MIIKNSTDNRWFIKVTSAICMAVVFVVYAIAHSMNDKSDSTKEKTPAEIRCAELDICEKNVFIYNVKERFDKRIQQRVISMYISTWADVKPSDYAMANTHLDLSVSDEDANKIMYRINQANIMGKSITLLVKNETSSKYTLYGLQEDLSKIVVPTQANLVLKE